jgi:hypothetical protein
MKSIKCFINKSANFGLVAVAPSHSDMPNYYRRNQARRERRQEAEVRMQAKQEAYQLRKANRTAAELVRQQELDRAFELVRAKRPCTMSGDIVMNKILPSLFRHVEGSAYYLPAYRIELAVDVHALRHLSRVGRVCQEWRRAVSETGFYNLHTCNLRNHRFSLRAWMSCTVRNISPVASTWRESIFHKPESTCVACNKAMCGICAQIETMKCIHCDRLFCMECSKTSLVKEFCHKTYGISEWHTCNMCIAERNRHGDDRRDGVEYGSD